MNVQEDEDENSVESLKMKQQENSKSKNLKEEEGFEDEIAKKFEEQKFEGRKRV